MGKKEGGGSKVEKERGRKGEEMKNGVRRALKTGNGGKSKNQKKKNGRLERRGKRTEEAE